MLEIDSKDSNKRKTENFAHEGYHAAHQDLATLFAKPTPLQKNDYVNKRMLQEAGSFLNEVKVNEELKRAFPEQAGNQNVEFESIDPHDPNKGFTFILNDLVVRDPHGKIDDWASIQKLDGFLRTHPATG